MEEKLIQIGIPLAVLLLPLVVIGLKLLAEKHKESLLGRLFAGASLVVSHLEVSMKAELLAASADGKMSPAEKAALKAKAIEELKKMFSPKELKALGPAADTLASGAIEQAVLSQKRPSP
jgi:hypothetical protein